MSSGSRWRVGLLSEGFLTVRWNAKQEGYERYMIQAFASFPILNSQSTIAKHMDCREKDNWARIPALTTAG